MRQTALKVGLCGMIIVLQPSHVVLLHEPHWVILVTWVWGRPPQRAAVSENEDFLCTAANTTLHTKAAWDAIQFGVYVCR